MKGMQRYVNEKTWQGDAEILRCSYKTNSVTDCGHPTKSEDARRGLSYSYSRPVSTRGLRGQGRREREWEQWGDQKLYTFPGFAEGLRIISKGLNWASGMFYL